MNRLLLVLMLIPSWLMAQDNPNYDPDFDGDGCYSVADILGLLPLFGGCNEPVSTFTCGDSLLFDNYWYETVLIGDQCWFAENLRTTVYANGHTIPSQLSGEAWDTTTTGAMTIYGQGGSCDSSFNPDFDPCNPDSSFEQFGALYNWYAVDDERGLCPNGWHVPTHAEWSALESFVTQSGYLYLEGTALKSTYGWTEQYGGGNGTDVFGFSVKPGGYSPGNTSGLYAGWQGVIWSSSEKDDAPGVAHYRTFYGPHPVIGSHGFPFYAGASVRCLKDPE